MTTTCQRCGRKGQLFLCGAHITELRDMLAGIPRLHQHLNEASLGQTRLGDGGRRTRRETTLIEYTDPNEGNTKLETDMNAGKFQINRVLGAVGINTRAATVNEALHDTLAAAARQLGQSTTAGTNVLALWLASRITAIATQESAGQTYADIEHHIERALQVINRPIPPLFCGPCPSPKEDGRTLCATRLMAKREAVQVHCPTCKETHNIAALMHRLANDLAYWCFTREEILLLMARMGTPLPERTFRRWRAEGKVPIRGYRRPNNPDGTRGAITTRCGANDEPVFRLADVRLLRVGSSEVSA